VSTQPKTLHFDLADAVVTDDIAASHIGGLCGYASPSMPDIGHKRGDHVIDLALIKKPRLWAMTISMLDQMMFNLSCGHEVVLGRMANMESWACEACGNTTDLTAEPFKSRLARDLDTAMQIDVQKLQKGNTITRLA
jgi:hypothetical protein